MWCDSDAGWTLHLLSPNQCFLETDGKFEVTSTLAEEVHEQLKVYVWVEQ